VLATISEELKGISDKLIMMMFQQST
jgi:hypothetical protein